MFEFRFISVSILFRFCSNIVPILLRICSDTVTIMFQVHECSHPTENNGFNFVQIMFKVCINSARCFSVWLGYIGLLSVWVHYKATDLVRTFPLAKTFRPLNSLDTAHGVVWVGDSNNADSYAHCILWSAHHIINLLVVFLLYTYVKQFSTFLLVWSGLVRPLPSNCHYRLYSLLTVPCPYWCKSRIGVRNRRDERYTPLCIFVMNHENVSYTCMRMWLCGMCVCIRCAY